MKNQKRIAHLEARKANAPPPAPVPVAWMNWRAELIDVLEENGLGSDWKWNGEDATFEREHAEFAWFGGFHVEVKISVALDPKKPLVDEITRLQSVRTFFIAACDRSLYEKRAGEIIAEARS